MNVLEVIRDFLNNDGAWQPRRFAQRKPKILTESVLGGKKRSRTMGKSNVLFGSITLTLGVKLSSGPFIPKYRFK